jgi:hypothetical protein
MLRIVLMHACEEFPMKPARFAAVAALLLCAGLTHAQIVITSNTTIAPGDPAYQNQDIVVHGCTVTINGAQNFTSLTIERNESNAPGIVTHDATFSSGGVNGMFITLAGDLFIQGADKGGLVASKIDVSAKGFPKGQGPGTAPEAGMSNGLMPAGGSYAGEGGVGENASTNPFDWTGLFPGTCYGSLTTPTEHGSGSGTKTILTNVNGAAGGGAIHLDVAGNALIEGAVIADGEGGIAGGAGGSIFLLCNDLSGNGTIRSQGGTAFGSLSGGGGGGGRVAIVCDISSFDGTMTAPGGNTQTVFVPTGSGGAGTVYLRQGKLQPQVVVDNAGAGTSQSYGATQLEGDVTFAANVIVRNHARVGPRRESTTPLHWTIDGSLSIDATSLVGAAGRGPRPAPTGNGGPGNSTGDHTAGGGGHGGAGGHGNSPFSVFGIAGIAHGDANAPISFGGAGGTSSNGRYTWGGGAFRLTTSGPITVDGAISADGAGRNPEDQVPHSGGGAGGSVWIEAPSISGPGFIYARGGNAGLGQGGGGGGGRIRIDVCDSGIAQANISVDGGAHAGTGATDGNPGTIVTTTPTTDWNGDGVVNSTDVSDFINDWFTDQAKGSLLTDFNHDGVSNSTDVSDFINAWFDQEPAC